MELENNGVFHAGGKAKGAVVLELTQGPLKVVCSVAKNRTFFLQVCYSCLCRLSGYILLNFGII